MMVHWIPPLLSGFSELSAQGLDLWGDLALLFIALWQLDEEIMSVLFRHTVT